MELKFFSDIIESLSKIFTTLKALKDIPKDKRDEIREALGGTFTMLNSTLNMIIIRLGEIYRIQDKATFLEEVSQLQYGDTWLASERAFRLCESLKHGLREWQTIDQSIINLVSLKNWNELKEQMENILKNETELAYYIEQNFREIANSAFDHASADAAAIKMEVVNSQKQLNEQRKHLMQLELNMYDLL